MNENEAMANQDRDRDLDAVPGEATPPPELPIEPTPAEHSDPLTAGDSSETHPGPEMRESFANLTASSLNLSENVSALNETLKIVNAMQAEQTRMRQQQEEMVSANRASEERAARTRRTLTFMGLGGAILLPLVSILVYAALINNVNELLEDQKARSFISCTTRNASTQANVAREEALAAAEADPEVKKIHADSAIELAKSIVDCDVYRRQ